jgi:adenylate cyclase class IV
MWTLRQADTFFTVAAGWLKLREAEGRPPEIISYHRSTDHAGPRPSEYDVIVVTDAAAWKRLLGRVLPVEGVVSKERTLWIYEQTRVHLDRVDGLGEFLELETVVQTFDAGSAREESDRVIRALALDSAEFVAVPYKDLLKRGGGR